MDENEQEQERELAIESRIANIAWFIKKKKKWNGRTRDEENFGESS